MPLSSVAYEPLVSMRYGEFEDPPVEIGNTLVTAVPNLEGLYWVDFTVFDVFPPED